MTGASSPPSVKAKKDSIPNNENPPANQVANGGNSPSFVAISNKATAIKTLESAVVRQSFLYGTTRTFINSPCSRRPVSLPCSCVIVSLSTEPLNRNILISSSQPPFNHKKKKNLGLIKISQKQIIFKAPILTSRFPPATPLHLIIKNLLFLILNKLALYKLMNAYAVKFVDKLDSHLSY